MKNRESTPETVIPVRQRLLQSAMQLFSETGIRATGIDTLLAHAGVAKMSLYTHFKSKEDLVVAVVEAQSQVLLEALAQSCAAAEPIKKARAEALFGAIRARVERDGFRGCEFIRTLSEFPDPDSAIHRAVVQHRAQLLQNLQDLFGRELGRELSLLLDGALVDGHATGRPDAADTALAVAQMLIAQRET